MKILVALLALVMSASAQANRLTPKEAAEGWLLLFDGESTFGWTVEGAAKWHVANAAIVADSGGYGWLRTNTQFADYSLKVDFQTAADGNSGIFLRSAKGKDPHVSGYELQIFDAHPKFPTGSILDAGRANKKLRIKPDQWHTYEVFHVGARCLVKLDGKKVLDLNDSKSASGYLGLQFNPDKPVAFRNIKLRPLGLAPLFNGRNLNGWQEVQPPKAPANPAVWSVKRGLLHVEKGPGQLETKTLYDDFILQMDVRTNSTDPGFHPNSGVFFRGMPGGYWTGYEVQIRNEFKDGDRSKPVDTGTGGIYFHQPARRVAGTDNEFYTKTIAAQGRHIATWINGYPVANWEDPYPEGTSPRKKQALLKAGPIALQAHDPKTNLYFRNLRIRSLKR